MTFHFEITEVNKKFGSSQAMLPFYITKSSKRLCWLKRKF